MKKYTINFKKNSTSRKIYTWERFANSVEEAKASAIKALDSEYYGEAVLMNVTEAPNA